MREQMEWSVKANQVKTNFGLIASYKLILKARKSALEEMEAEESKISLENTYYTFHSNNNNNKANEIKQAKEDRCFLLTG